jgi:uncharacterized membrane protein YsdA (DUF1294 family)
MSNYLVFLIGFFVVTNSIAFALMWIDKVKAHKKGAQRISEGMLFFMATIFGSVGVYIGMYFFRHKTKKWYFIAGIPLLILQNVALLLMIFYILTGETQSFMSLN